MAARMEEWYPEHDISMDGNGNYTGATITYFVFEVNSENEAIGYVYANVAKTYNGLVLNEISVAERMDMTTFKVDCVYGENTLSVSVGSGGYTEEDPPTISFEIASGTERITMGYGNTVYVNPGLTESDAIVAKYQNAQIGWNGKSGEDSSVTGVDIVKPAIRETITKIMKYEDITGEVKRTWANLEGKINSGTFNGWEAGEVMFMGASYQAPIKGKTLVTVSFHFAINLNEENIAIAGINIAEKKGWDYVWGVQREEVANDTSSSTTEAVIISKVSKETDFSVLGLEV